VFWDICGMILVNWLPSDASFNRDYFNEKFVSRLPPKFKEKKRKEKKREKKRKGKRREEKRKEGKASLINAGPYK
jgi:hypothetical protein